MTKRTGKETLALAVIILLGCSAMDAQYVEPEHEARFETRYLAGGALGLDVTPLTSNVLPDSEAITFARVMPLLNYRQGSVDIYLGYTRYSLRGQTCESILFGMQISRDFMLTGSPSRGLSLPVLIGADFTKAEAGGIQRKDFNVASIGIGAGLKFRTGGSDAELLVQGVQFAHFSFEGFATGTGSSMATTAEAVLLLPRVPIANGIALSYRFRLQTWKMNDDRLNYKLLYHGPSVGVMF